MTQTTHSIIYTHTDEAPALATCSLLPIIQAFADTCAARIETRDISLAGRILAQFPDRLAESQRIRDDLAELGDLAKRPEANIIKLPNISASIPQLKAAIAELQARGLAIPDYPDEPADDRQREILARYDRVQGSAVNPVLREGNSDRRAPGAVKRYARRNPHPMGAWSRDSRTQVVHMTNGDFRSNEQSVTMDRADRVRIELVGDDGTVTLLRDARPVLQGEVLDATKMSVRELTRFLDHEIADARRQGLLFSLHLKATMMKVSDPIIFGHAVRTYFRDVFTKHGATLSSLGVNPNDGLGSMLTAIRALPDGVRAEIEADIQAARERGPELAMVDSARDVTNLHVPSDVIVDASMPAMIRSSGQMWNRAGQLQDTKAVIPDSSYADVYAETIAFCKAHGAFDPATMGTVPNVGLMAQKAEEYGSHDKTFEIPVAGRVRVVREDGTPLLEHRVEAGDIWRMCQTRDAAIRDWVRLAVSRARATGAPAVFWLDADRPHDRELIRKVEAGLESLDTTGLEIRIMAPGEATRFTLGRLRAGQDTISVTGNVLRDYLTDLFPILELGTSAKMLSIVPLLNGGRLFETGAGGSAPKHVQQFLAENHLRWDSLGEFLALAVSLEHLGDTTANPGASLLGRTLDEATGTLLEEGKSPSRKVGELDNRGSHFYLALYWAEAMAAQQEESRLSQRFSDLARRLRDNEEQIVNELNGVQGRPVDIGGYYAPDPQRTALAMRPSATFNQLLAGFSEPEAVPNAR
jgi:isocitrate dehydrogenase